MCHENILKYESLMNASHSCIRGYPGGRDKASYGPGSMRNATLALELPPDAHSKDAWVYTTDSGDGSFPIRGELGTYDGNGYKIELIVNSGLTNKVIKELSLNQWIDRQTRAVFLEFTLYNADSNLFSLISMWMEVPLTGGPLLHTHATMIRIYATGFNEIYVRVMEVIFVALLIASVGICILRLKSEQSFRTFWKNPSVWLDFFLFTSSLFLIIAFALRYFSTKELVTDVKGSITYFISFHLTVFYHTLFMYTLSFVIFLAFLKGIVLLHLAERIAKLAATIRYSAYDVFSTLALLTIGIFAFATLGYLSFHGETDSYRSLTSSMGQLIGLALGEFKGLEGQLSDAKPLLQFYVVAFALFAQIIMFNVLIAVIIESHNAFKNKSALEAKEQELVRIIFGQVKRNVKKALDKYTQMDGE